MTTTTKTAKDVRNHGLNFRLAYSILEYKIPLREYHNFTTDELLQVITIAENDTKEYCKEIIQKRYKTARDEK